MSALALILALFLAQDPTAATPPADPGDAPADASLVPVDPAASEPVAAPEAPPAPLPFPVGAPRDDYGLVAWCYGALRGYTDLHDTVMPDVIRIETRWRPPNSDLAADLKVYADMQKQARMDLKAFARAMQAAEKASLRPINAEGAKAVTKGRGIWISAPGTTTARMAQEWMSWTLPARCGSTAEALEARSKLGGAAFKANEPEPAPEPVATETPPEAPAPAEEPAAPAEAGLRGPQ